MLVYYSTLRTFCRRPVICDCNIPPQIHSTVHDTAKLYDQKNVYVETEHGTQVILSFHFRVQQSPSVKENFSHSSSVFIARPRAIYFFNRDSLSPRPPPDTHVPWICNYTEATERSITHQPPPHVHASPSSVFHYITLPSSSHSVDTNAGSDNHLKFVSNDKRFRLVDIKQRLLDRDITFCGKKKSQAPLFLQSVRLLSVTSVDPKCGKNRRQNCNTKTYVKSIELLTWLATHTNLFSRHFLLSIGPTQQVTAVRCRRQGRTSCTAEFGNEWRFYFRMNCKTRGK